MPARDELGELRERDELGELRARLGRRSMRSAVSMMGGRALRFDFASREDRRPRRAAATAPRECLRASASFSAPKETRRGRLGMGVSGLGWSPPFPRKSSVFGSCKEQGGGGKYPAPSECRRSIRGAQRGLSGGDSHFRSSMNMAHWNKP